MIHEGLFGRHDDLTSFLRAYYDILAGQIFEGTHELYVMAKEVVREIQPTFEFGFDAPPTAHELFCMIQGMEPRADPEPFLDVGGYDPHEKYHDADTVAAIDAEAYDPDQLSFTSWDPSAPFEQSSTQDVSVKFSHWGDPVDDTDQFPDGADQFPGGADQ